MRWTAVALTILAATPASAGAATVTLSESPLVEAPKGGGTTGGPGVTVTAAPGEGNHLAFSRGAGGTTLVVRDPAAPLTPAAGCATTAPGEVTCTAPVAAITTLTVDAGDGDDTVDASSSNDLVVSVDGGPGDDLLVGADDDDTLIGNDGDDQLAGAEGDDTLIGGAGADVLHGNAGDDFLAGGAGADLLLGDAGSDAFDLTGDPFSTQGERVTCGAGARDRVDSPAAFETVSPDCERIDVAIPGQDVQPLRLLGTPRIAHGAIVLRVSCDTTDCGDRTSARFTVRAGGGTARGSATLHAGAIESVRLRGAHVRRGQRIRVTVAGTQVEAGEGVAVRGGFITSLR